MKKNPVSGQNSEVPAIFSGVPEGDIAYLLRHGRIVHYTVGETIITPGDVANYMYVVVFGEIGLYDDARLNKVCRIGDAFGETGILGHQPQRRHAIAMTKCDVFRLCGSSLQRLLASGRGSRVLLNAISMLSEPAASSPLGENIRDMTQSAAIR